MATHDGHFHADEVFAVAIMRLIYPKVCYVRTREPELYKKADVRIDIGGRYDPRSGDFDHHQIGRAGMRPNGIPYASSGLVWKQFGKRLAHNRVVRDRIDERVIQGIDAGDNGVSSFTVRSARPYTLFEVIDSFNEEWVRGRMTQEAAFRDALAFACGLLAREIRAAEYYVKSRSVLMALIRIAKRSGSRFIVLRDYKIPWQEVVIEKSDLLYVVYPGSSRRDWRVRVVPMSMNGFRSRATLPMAWAGLKGQALARVTGVGDAVFCHTGRFIAGAESRQGAIRLAEIAVQSLEKRR